MLDLRDIEHDAADQDRARDFELRDPVDGAPTGLRLRIVGPDSATARRAQLALLDELADAAGPDACRRKRGSGRGSTPLPPSSSDGTCARTGRRFPSAMLPSSACSARRGGGKATEDEDKALERKAFRTYLRYGAQTPIDEIKALTVSEDDRAGYLAPPEMSTEFVRDLVEFSPIRSVASVRSTGSPSVKYPRRTGITSAAWEGELEEAEESDVSFGMLEVTTHKLQTYVDVSNELLADSAGQAEAEVRLALAEDFGQTEAAAFVAGTGVKQPEGLLFNAEIPFTETTSADLALAPDPLIDLLYAMPAAYRNAPGARWAMNGSTLAEIRKLKDEFGRLIWQPALAAGQPETLLGKPVLEMVDMPDIGDGAFPIIFGDFAGYRIVDRLALSILSDPYTQARKGVTRIHATRRVGGRVLQAARFRKLKTTAA